MTAHPYDLVIGLDRSDQKADLCLIDTPTGQRRTAVIATAPEALWEWLLELRQQHPGARVGLWPSWPWALWVAGFWELDESSRASQRQNSTAEKAESWVVSLRRLVRVSCQTSRFSPIGTK